MNTENTHHTQKLSKNQWWTLISASSGFGLENMDVMFLSFALSSIIAQLNISQGEAGLIGSVTTWGMLVGAIVFGICADKFGRVKIFSSTIILFALATALMGFANNLTEIYILRFITGIGAGGEYGIGITLIADAFSRRKMGKYSSIASIGGQLGAVLAAILAAAVIPKFGWHGLFLFGLIPIILVFFVRLNLKESPKFLKNNKEDHKLSTVREVLNGMFKGPRVAYQTIGLMIMATVQISGYFGLMNWLPTIMQQRTGITVAGSSLWMLATILGMSIGMLTFGTILDHIGARTAFGIFLIASAMMVYLLLFARNMWSMLLIGAIVGFFCNGMYGGYGAVVSNLYPENVKASANNIIVGVGRAVGGFSSLIIGILMDHFNLTIVMLFLSTLYIISFLVMLTIPGFKALSKKEMQSDLKKKNIGY